MVIFFLFLGAFFIIVAINNKVPELAELTKQDFGLGRTSFIPWVIAIFALGAIGYFKPLKPLSNAMMLLAVVAIVLANNPKGQPGFFERFTQALKV